MNNQDGQWDQRANLWSLDVERDACGVGLVARLSGEPSHDVIRKGIEILIRLTHRGACGCDEHTGDGAGLMAQLPDRFFRSVFEGRGALPPACGPITPRSSIRSIRRAARV